MSTLDKDPLSKPENQQDLKESPTATKRDLSPGFASNNPYSTPPPPAGPAVPLPQDVTRPYPQTQSQMQNAGMMAGTLAGVMGQGSVGGDMLLGGVVGGMVGQRVAQAQNHAFYREQAMLYREGRAAGTIPPPEELYKDQKKASWWSREGRAQRRAERWERRAKRSGAI